MPWSRACALLAVLLAPILLALVAPPARSAEALVAVATNFAETAAALKPAFERATGHSLAMSTGSTGKLYAQIRNGAPFHVLLSADSATPERLERERAAVQGTRFTYAVGRLVLWSRDPRLIGDGDGIAALRAGAFRHLAIANPDLAPYGVAARDVLRKLGLWEGLSGRLVMGQNVGQVHAMVASGNAQLGFVALSSVLGPRAAAGSHWEVPQDLFTPIRQDAVLLRAGAANPAAIAFLEFLRGDEAKQAIARFGYGPG